MPVYCRKCKDDETGSLAEIEDNSLDIWNHFEYEHPDIFETYRSTYETMNAKQVLGRYLEDE